MPKMSENNMESVSFIDTTLQLRWKITKEMFDNCAFLEEIHSEEFTVPIGSEETYWGISMYLKGDEESERDQVVILLKCFDGDKEYSVLFEFRLETFNGYWPDNFVEKMFSKRYRPPSKSFVEFDPNAEDNNPATASNSWGTTLSSTEDFRQHFVDDKGTLVATLVIDMEGKKDRNHMDLADEFTKDMRSLASLRDMNDFTIICSGKHFPCLKPLLASRSEFFKGMFTHFKDKKVLKIDYTSPEIVKIVLKFMYNGLLPNDIDTKAKEMIHLSDMFGLKGLTDSCIVSLVKKLCPENATETLTIVDEHAPNSEERSKILDYIKKEAAQIVKTQHWETFVQNYPKLVTDIVLTPSPPSD